MGASMTPGARATLDAVVNSFLTGDEAAFATCFNPDVLWFGTLTGTDVRGIGALRGVLRAFRDVAKPRALRSLRLFGVPPAVAMLGEFDVDEGVMEVVQVLRFGADRRIARGHSIVDPRPLLMGPRPKAPGPDAPALARVHAFFRAYEAGDLAALVAMAAPRLEYLGTQEGLTEEGLAAVIHRFVEARTKGGIERLVPLKYYGMGPQAAVLTAFQGPGGRPSAEGILHFRFDEALRVTHFSVTWDPADFRDS